MRIYKNRKLKNKQEFFHKFTVKSLESVEPADSTKTAELPENEEAKKKRMPLFLDDMDYTAFARRLAWSPDGTFLLTPASQLVGEKQEHVCYGFLKAQINKPAFMLPGMNESVTAIRFHPRLFSRRSETTALLDLPYTMLFALATNSSLLVYSSDSAKPIGIIKQPHLDTINDLSWAEDGGKAVLVAASSDGFCSLVDVDLGALKLSPIADDQIPEELKTYYQSRSLVTFEATVDAIKKELTGKSSTFVKVGFRCKNREDV